MTLSRSSAVVRVSMLALGGVAVAFALAGPSVEIKHNSPRVSYAVAYANPPSQPPSGGGGNDPSEMIRLCKLLGVSGAVVDEAPKTCGTKNPGDLSPTAKACTTGNGDNLEEGGFRTCESCKAYAPEPPCKKDVKAKAKIESKFEITVWGVVVSCKAGASYEASASSTVTYVNTDWKPNPMGMGSDKAITYFSSTLTVSATAKAAVQLSGECTFAKVGGGGASLDISCEVATEGNKFALTKPRDATTCPKNGPVADASTVDTNADASTDTKADASTTAKTDASTADAGTTPVIMPKGMM